MEVTTTSAAFGFDLSVTHNVSCTQSLGLVGYETQRQERRVGGL